MTPKLIHALVAAAMSATLALPANARAPEGSAAPVAATYGGPGARRIALFLSGDGGWNLGVVSMAQAVARRGYIVAGIDFPKYLRERDHAPCISIANDLAATAGAVAAEHGLSMSAPPLLVGYSSGATGVYGALSQAKAGTFSGGLSLGFAPDLKTLHAFCPIGGLTARPDAKLGFVYGKAQLATPWKALQGEIDQDVSAEATKSFVQGVGNAQIVMLPKVGHGFSVERNWMPQFEAALAGLEAR